MSYSPNNPNGSATSANSAPVVIASDQATVPVSNASLPLPTGASTSANQSTGNTSLSSIDTKTPALGQALAAASVPVILPSATVTTLTPPAAITGYSTEATLALIKAKTDNIDVALSTRTKPADAQHVIVDSGVTTGLTDTQLRASAVPVTANAGTNLNTSALALDATLTGGTQQTKITNGTQVADTIAGDSGQNTVLQAGSRKEVTYTTTIAAAVASTDVSNYRWVSVQQTNTGGSSTTTFQGSNDNTNWTSIALALSTSTGANSLSINTVSSTAWYGPLHYRYFRLNVTGIASGTTAGTVEFFSTSPSSIINATQASQAGTWTVADTGSTSGGLSLVTGSVGATATAIKASAGQLYGYHFLNTTAAVAYVQIFNVAFGSVTLGTTTPTISIGIPANGAVTMNFDKGIAFGTAISYACTTTRTGLTGATCDVNFFYK